MPVVPTAALASVLKRVIKHLCCRLAFAAEASFAVNAACSLQSGLSEMNNGSPDD
jgi:hypothetical protein